MLQLANEIIKGHIIYEDISNEFIYQDKLFIDRLLKVTKQCLQKESKNRIGINQLLKEFVDIIIDCNDKQSIKNEGH